MAFGRGKVILFGEHGVVHGRPALAAGLARGVTATAIAADADALVVEAWDLEVSPSPEAEQPLGRALWEVLRRFDGERAPLRVTAEVALPAGAGLGCSAALGVAVIGAVDEALGAKRSPEALAEACLVWERVFHGNPSGVDSAMAAMGGVAVFRRGETLVPIVPRTPIRLVIADSGETSSTMSMVAEVARQHERAPARIDAVFDGMAAIVQNGRLAVETGDLRSLGQLMTLNQTLLNTLMISTAKLEEMCSAAREAGALGAKLTGAGGGGCMIALVDTVARGEAVCAALSPLCQSAFVAEAGA